MPADSSPLTRHPWTVAIAKLSSGTKMLFIMTAALMPLGVIALLASLQSAQSKRIQHAADARLIATAEARQIDLTVSRAANVVRFAGGAAVTGARCRSLLFQASRLLPPGTRVALVAPGGGLQCATPGFVAADRRAPASDIRAELRLLGAPGLRFTVATFGGGYGVGELPAETLKAAIGVSDAAQGVALRQGPATLQLATSSRARPLDRSIVATASIGDGQLVLSSVTITNAVSAIEILLVLLPLVMWAAAAIIGWVVMNEMLLRPLARLQRAVAEASETSGTDHDHFYLPRLQTPAREIGALGEAFATATDQIAQRERRLAEGLRHQVLLTREVHHRVKNNLQVVSSLINLHARGTQGDVAGAYASIQRRVDALAVVHRNHYAELEEHRGVALRALVAELTANLRATAPPRAANMAITLDMLPVQVSQDTAVPVSFLITEIVELLMDHAPATPVHIMLRDSGDRPDRARLSIGSIGLAQPERGDWPEFERFGRIITGLARQLRSSLDFDSETGCYAIAIPIIVEEPAEKAPG